MGNVHHPDELDANTRLAVHRTDLAFESNLLGVDRTQMSVLRTSLSLIGFGFTIYKFFHDTGRDTANPGVFGPPARNFGLFLVVLGIVLLAAGLINRFRSVRALNRRRQGLYDEGLLWRPPSHATSPNMVVSTLLLIGGLAVVLGIVARVGPFS